MLNTKERQTLEKTLQRALKPLPLEEVLDLKEAGAQVLDARDAAEFAKAHLVESLNIGLGGQYATWAGTLLDRQRPIVLIAEPGREEEAATRLGRIGFDHVAGYLRDGIQVLETRPDLVDGWERVNAAALANELASSDPPLLLDVRTPPERQQKHIAGSLHIPLNHLQERLQELPSGRRLAVYCAGGYRSSIAASILQQNGVTDLLELAGGIAAWEAAKLSTVS